MHARLEEVQFSGLSAPPKPDCHQPAQMLFPSLQGEGLGEEGFVASCQLEKKKNNNSERWIAPQAGLAGLS